MMERGEINLNPWITCRTPLAEVPMVSRGWPATELLRLCSGLDSDVEESYGDQLRAPSLPRR